MAKTQHTKPKSILVKSKDSFKNELLKRISIGENLFKREVVNIEQLHELNRDQFTWGDYNKELLKQSFNNHENEYLYDYSRLNSGSGIMDYFSGVDTNTNSYKINQTKNEIHNSINWLNRLIEKLDLIQAADTLEQTSFKEINFSMDIFISHSSLDSEIAKSLIELIRSALNIPANKIRCTSVAGYKLPIGAETDDQLRKEIFDSKVFIGIISSLSIKSTYVLFELGARWGVQLPLFPLVVSKVGTGVLDGPLKNINALNCCFKEDIFQFLNDLAMKLEVKLENPSVYTDKIDELTALAIKKSQQDEKELFIPVEIEAEFKGNWKEYLERNLNSEIPIHNGAPVGFYIVIIQFIVGAEGHVMDAKALTTHGYGMEQEALRVIKNSPPWNPADQNGRKVKAYRKQMITFQVRR